MVPCRGKGFNLITTIDSPGRCRPHCMSNCGSSTWRMASFSPHNVTKERILKLLNLEDTPPDNIAPSRLRDGREWEAYRAFPVFFRKVLRCMDRSPRADSMCSTRCCFNHDREISTLNVREFTMSARNGDKSRFNRERKEKIARRQRTRELLKREAAGRKSVDPSVPAKPRSVSA
jgi:hypothetical protein